MDVIHVCSFVRAWNPNMLTPIHLVAGCTIHVGKLPNKVTDVCPSSVLRHPLYLGQSEPMLGGYHNFMIPIRSGFHKVIYKRVRFSQKDFFFKNSTLDKGINNFYKKLN
jgi:hypothetical protein